MNSLVSYDWLKHYVDLKGIKPEEFASRMSLSGPAVEKIIPMGRDLDKVVVGRIVEIKAHPNADKLRIAVTDIGHSKLEIVCGGSNIKENQFVAVALVGARVRWHGEGDLVKLEPAEIRGVKSEGMICAANEIGLFDAFPHEERFILDLGEAIPGIDVAPGTPLADALGLMGDVTLDIEVTTNRVDAMGIIGLGREAAAILDRKFLWNEKTLKAPKKGDKVKVTVHDKKLCPRYMAVRINGVTNGPSPWWMKKRLMAAGMNSISLLVDITNYVMLEYAQPLHVFDVKRLRFWEKQPEIHVRLARPGEKMKALGAKDYELDDQTLVIADAEGAVAIAGIKGGEGSGTYGDTTDIIFEAAAFDPVSIRRTARRLNLYSDSQLRFEKGLSVESPEYALARAVNLTLELAGGEIMGPVTDVRAGKYKAASYGITTEEVNKRIGLDIPAKRQVKILKDLGFRVSARGKTIKAEVPWWRDHDIESSQDLVEEIARAYGYANIPPVLPVGEPSNKRVAPEILWEDRIRTVAKGAGLTETYSYSFVSEDIYKKAGYDPSVCLHATNPLTEEFKFMRTSLLPSLLQIVAENQDRYKEQRLFEVQNVYYRKNGGWNDLPDEYLELGCAFLMSGSNGWKHAKGFVEHLFHEFGIEDISWSRVSTDTFWHPGRTVQAFKQGALIATIGEISPEILKRFKIDGRLAMIDCPLREVFKLAKDTKSYTPPPMFPESKRDLAIVIDRAVEYDDIARLIKGIDPMITGVEWFDTYAGKGLADGKKSVALHLVLSSSEKTLTSAEVDAVVEKISLGLREKFSAELR